MEPSATVARDSCLNEAVGRVEWRALSECRLLVSVRACYVAESDTGRVAGQTQVQRVSHLGYDDTSADKGTVLVSMQRSRGASVSSIKESTQPVLPWRFRSLFTLGEAKTHHDCVPGAAFGWPRWPCGMLNLRRVQMRVADSVGAVHWCCCLSIDIASTSQVSWAEAMGCNPMVSSTALLYGQIACRAPPCP